MKRLRIINDANSDSPRSWDTLGEIVYKHSRYCLGELEIQDPIEWLMSELNLSDKSIDMYRNKYQNESDLMSALVSRMEKKYIIIPLYIYDHSGITISTTPFNCRWDSGQFGWIYVSKDRVKDEYKNLSKDWRKKYHKGKSIYQIAECVLTGEVETFDQYLRGDVWGFLLEESNDGINWKEIDSCWGFYGSDPYKNGMSDHINLDGVEICEPEY